MGMRAGARRCAQLAAIVGGAPSFMNGVCLIQLLRSDIEPAILGVPTRSPLVLPVFFTVEGNDDQGRALNLGEAVLLQEETQTVMRVLRDNGIIVSALHNHWLFERPRLMYMHWEAVMEPERFLQVSLAALRAAGVQTRRPDGMHDTMREEARSRSRSRSRATSRSDGGRSPRTDGRGRSRSESARRRREGARRRLRSLQPGS